MLYIYTENFYLKQRVKIFFKRILRKDKRGPEAVVDSLLTGLRELEKEYVLNEKPGNFIETACVISGVRVLKWAILQKQMGNIKKIIAGPNLVVSPNDSEGILKNQLIDTIIVPSVWVKEYYVKIDPSLESKIQIWPAGVGFVDLAKDKKVFDFIIYNKLKNPLLLNKIKKILEQKNIVYKVVNYGKFKKDNYYNNLKQTKYLIYLSASESQGIAMFEAWSHNVPTLVWESGKFRKDGIEIYGKISAPYLNSQNGLTFTSTDNFEENLQKFINSEFSPRDFIKENFTNSILAGKYLKIIEEY